MVAVEYGVNVSLVNLIRYDVSHSVLEIFAWTIFVPSFEFYGLLIERTAEVGRFKCICKRLAHIEVTYEQVTGCDGHVNPTSKLSRAACLEFHAGTVITLGKWCRRIAVGTCTAHAEVESRIACSPVAQPFAVVAEVAPLIEFTSGRSFDCTEVFKIIFSYRILHFECHSVCPVPLSIL